jgi:glycosyltransferase involved in cell wall biosynthesis
VHINVSVIVCSLNGGGSIGACVDALADQTYPHCEVIVVDDGSSDGTGEIAEQLGATVLRHEANRGLAAARNTGVRAATGEVIVFTDDDCRPDSRWIVELVAGYRDPSIIGVGGQVEAMDANRLLVRYLKTNNPLAPLELDLARGQGALRRLWLYIQRTWCAPNRRADDRWVYSLVGANMSFRAQAFAAVGLFADEIRFGGEDEEFCSRIRHHFGNESMLFRQQASVAHHFDPELRDTLRRARAYGRGNARGYRTGYTKVPPLFPLPVVTLVLALRSLWRPWTLVTAVALPIVGYPYVLARWARSSGLMQRVGFCYIQFAQECATIFGFVEGLAGTRCSILERDLVRNAEARRPRLLSSILRRSRWPRSRLSPTMSGRTSSAPSAVSSPNESAPLSS